MGWFDVHAHLTHPRLCNLVPEMLERAQIAGVTTVVSNGLNPGDNEAVKKLARTYPQVRPAYGFYPVDTVLPEMRAAEVDYPREGPEAGFEQGYTWLCDHVDEAFAIGEIGLDGYWVPEAFWALQEERFVRLVRLAMEADKPIIIHTRKRERRALELLEELGARRVNWHCFGGKVKLARAIAERGHYLSIPANARRSESFTRMLETLPRDRLLLETDCPYLGPEREIDSEPAYVARTAMYAAECWGAEMGDVERQMTDNFAALFGAEP